MSVREAYDQWALTYDADRNLTRDLDAQVTAAVLAGAPCSRVLELGCGTGKNTAFLAQLGASVLALDFSAAMLRQAQQLTALREWWHEEDHAAPPRLVSFMFDKPPL